MNSIKKVDSNTLDSVIDGITKGIQFAYNTSKLKKIRKRINTPWWNHTLEINRKIIRALRRKFQFETDDHKRTELKIKFKKERAAYKRLVLTTKTTAFKEY